MAKADKILQIAQLVQLLKDNPDISAKELASLLNMNLRTVYRYINQLQQKQADIPDGLKPKGQNSPYDKIFHLNLALNQPQLSLIYKLSEATLQNPSGLSEPEIQTLEQVEELMSKALLVKPTASPASINFLFEPTKGKCNGEVSLGFVGNIDMSKPLHLVSSINTNALHLIFSSLFTYPRWKPEGLLVKSWKVSDDLLTWDFDLKEGVRFHNGSELTAEDVEFTYRNIADPEFGSSLASIYSFASNFEVISKHKFQIRLKQPYADLLYRLWVPILPKEALQKYKQFNNSDPKNFLIGSGPFKFELSPKDDTMILKANENYFEEGYPHLERVVLKAYPTSRDLFNAAASGEVDLVSFGLTISELEQLGKIIPFQVYPIEMPTYYVLLFNLKDKTFSDIRVRKAISHAIDRESLIRKQLRGYGKVSNGPLSPLSWAYNEKLQPVKHDIELAKALLVEAGWEEKADHWQKGERELELEVAIDRYIPDYIKLAIGLKLQLSKLKVNVKLRYIDSNELAPNAFEAAILLINSGGDPGHALRAFWYSKSKINLASYHNPEVDELLDWEESIASINKGKLIYDRVQELIAADHPAAFLCTSAYFLGSNCVLQNASESLVFPDLFSSIKSWTIKRERTIE